MGTDGPVNNKIHFTNIVRFNHRNDFQHANNVAVLYRWCR